MPTSNGPRMRMGNNYFTQTFGLGLHTRKNERRKSKLYLNPENSAIEIEPEELEKRRNRNMRNYKIHSIIFVMLILIITVFSACGKSEEEIQKEKVSVDRALKGGWITQEEAESDVFKLLATLLAFF